MLKLLLRLWWMNIRRQESKRGLIIWTLIVVIYFCALVGIFVGADIAGSPLQKVEAPSFVGLILVVVVALGDFFTKLTIKDEVTIMDDYLKARPIPQNLWVKFLMLTQAARWGTVTTPLIFLVILFMLQSIGQAFVCFFLMILFCYANNLFATCYQKTSDKFLKFSVIVGWIGMVISISLNTFIFSLSPSWLQYLSMLVIAVAVIVGLGFFLANEDNYDEGKVKPTKQFSFGRVNLFTMQLFGILRAKNLRDMVLIEAAIFIGNTYLMAFLGDDTDSSMLTYAIVATVLPPLTLSQETFGVEANFFQGLMSKPITVKHLLGNCYYFYLLLSFICAVLILPLVFITDQLTILQLLAALALAAFVNLFNLPTCLYSSRLEMFSKAFFNYQGAKIKLNAYSVVAMLFPLAFFIGAWYFVGEESFLIVSLILGSISVIIHRHVIGFVAKIFESRRYARMEAFMK